MDLYFGFGIFCEKSQKHCVDSPLITCIESGDGYVLVLKESVRKVNGVSQPIGISSMNAHLVGYMEEFVHTVHTIQEIPDWIVFSKN